jgi:hypothetical protein
MEKTFKPNWLPALYPGGGNLPRPMGRSKEVGFSICDEFDLSYFPDVTDAKRRCSRSV